MFKTSSVLLFILLSCVTLFHVNAAGHPVAGAEKINPEDSVADDEDESYRGLLLEIDYGSNRGYEMKRKFLQNDTSYKFILGSITYTANSGFYATGGVYNTPGSKKKWDEFFAGVGYDFTISEAWNTDGSIGYTYYSFNEASKKSSTILSSHNLNAYINQRSSVVDVKLSADYYLGGTYKDVDLIIDIDHAFYIDHILSKKDFISIDPTLSTVFATMNFLKGSIRVNENPVTKKQKEVNALLMAAREDLGNFRLTNYEFILPLNYEIGKFNFEVAWRYYIPGELPAILNSTGYSFFTAMVSVDFLR